MRPCAGVLGCRCAMVPAFQIFIVVVCSLELSGSLVIARLMWAMAREELALLCEFAEVLFEKFKDRAQLHFAFFLVECVCAAVDHNSFVFISC